MRRNHSVKIRVFIWTIEQQYLFNYLYLYLYLLSQVVLKKECEFVDFAVGPNGSASEKGLLIMDFTQHKIKYMLHTQQDQEKNNALIAFP